MRFPNQAPRNWYWSHSDLITNQFVVFFGLLADGSWISYEFSITYHFLVGDTIDFSWLQETFDRRRLLATRRTRTSCECCQSCSSVYRRVRRSSLRSFDDGAVMFRNRHRAKSIGYEMSRTTKKAYNGDGVKGGDEQQDLVSSRLQHSSLLGNSYWSKNTYFFSLFSLSSWKMW